MKFSQHIITSGMVSVALWPVYHSVEISVMCFLTGVFIDIDHFIDYFREFGFNINVPKFFQVFKGKNINRVWIPLHSWELFGMMLFFSWLGQGNNWMIGLITGYFLHMILDQLFNKPGPWSYFLVFRYTKKFSHKVLFPD